MADLKLPDTPYVLAREGDGYSADYLLSEAGYGEDQMQSYARAAIASTKKPKHG